MNQSATQPATEQQIAEAMAAERESLRPECRADATRLERLLAPDFHEFGTSGREIGHEGTAARIAEETDPNGEPILVENMRGWLLAEGLVMLKYVSENSGRRSNRTSLWRRVEPGNWQMFHHRERLQLPDADRHHSPGPNAPTSAMGVCPCSARHRLPERLACARELHQFG